MSLPIIQATLLPERDTSNVDMTLSVSKAKTFDDCKAKFRFAYIEKLPRKDMDFHIFGKFLHAFLENFHDHFIQNPGNDWEPFIPIAWQMAMDGSEKEAAYKTLLTKDQIVEARSIVDEYKSILKEEGMPNVLAVEKEFYINLNNFVLLNGFIDRVQLDKDGMLHVADYKTTKDPKYLKDFFQLMTYGYALMLEDESIKRIRTSFILLRHNFDYLTQEFTRDEIMKVGEKFVKYADNIVAEKAFRPNPQFLCKYCDYIDHCDSGRGFLVKKGVIDYKPTVGLRKW